MRKLIATIAGAAALAAGGAAPAMAAGHAAAAPTYYLALGDSLARGAQPYGPIESGGPRKTVPTNHGYTNDLYAQLHRHRRALRLMELGCLGETTTTMLHGGICHYAAGSQLKAAINFIRHHRIALITLDIGANDVDRCGSLTGAALYTCVGRGVQTIQQNVPKIVAALRRAAGRHALMIGMTYYDPFLAAWLDGPSGKALAAQSVPLARSVNDTLTKDYKQGGMRVADVGTAYRTYVPFSQQTTYKGQSVPVAVAYVCRFTWMCAPKPYGPNIHANAAGYTLIAKVFEGQL